MTQRSSGWHPPAPYQVSEKLLSPPESDLLFGVDYAIAPIFAYLLITELCIEALW